MNFAGKSGWHADFGSSAHGHIDSLPKGADTVTVPDAHLLFSGDYARSGTDLIISDHLHRVVVPNYFNGDKRPALVSADGAPLDPKFIDALTGHVQYAQAAGTVAAAKVAGHVVKMTGSASIVRNGVTIDVNNGDVIYQNDVVQTGSGSTLGLVMIDGTTFNLTANARLMMNDLTYDATSTSNTSLFTLVQGAATFVAGQVAKTGDMKVSTPVATMGIRGTAVILDISAIDGTVSVSVVNQRDGQIHALQVYNARGDLIGTVTSNGSSLTLRPTATFEVIAQESGKTVAQILTEFNAFQQLLSTYEIGKQLVPNTPFPTDGRRGDNTQQPLTKFAIGSSSPVDNTPVKSNADIGGAKDAKGGGAVDPLTAKPTGEITDPIKVTLKLGDDAPIHGEVAATSIPFVVTPSPVSRISSGPGDHFGPVMSADGQFVTYDPDGAIYLFDRQTGATKTIASPGAGFTYGSPTISSDGHFIVYQGSDGTQSWIFVYNNDASDPAHYGQITRLMPGGQAAISGDGSKLVVERGGSIGLYDQQGHELANFTGAAVGITGTLWKPAISADGHIIAFWSSDSSSPGGAGQLFTYDLSTATVRSIASTATDAGTSAASFSADGHYVVYQSDTPGGHSEIYLYDLRAGQVVFHTANPDPSYNPVLSPDGHFIILASDARLTADDKNAVTDVYVIDVTDPSHPAYKLVSVLDDGTQGDDASNLGATISAGGQFVAFGSRASNFSSHDTPGTGDIFVVDPTSGHSAIILESRNSPAMLTTSGVIKLTGDHSGIKLGVSDSRITASFDAHGDIQWSFSEPRSDFASLQPGEISVQRFVITLSTDRSTTEIPVKVSIYDVDQPVIPVADAAPVASPVTLAAGTEDSSYTINSAALLAGVVDIDGPSLSISAVGILSGGGSIVDNHNGSFSYTPAPNYSGPVVFSYTASDGTLSASSTATLNIAGVNDAPTFVRASINVIEGGAVVLDPVRIISHQSTSGTTITIINPGFSGITVDDPDSSSFTFTVSNVTHGVFQTTVDGTHWNDATKFTSAEVDAGHVRFLQNGDDAIPGFSIQADDGAAVNSLSNVLAGSVGLFGLVNDTPVLTKAVLAVSEGGTVVLDAASIGVSDPDSTSFTFIVSNVSRGAFETTTDGTNWAAAATFTTADLNAGHVRFVHDGGEDAPTFSIQADDGAGSNSLSNVLAGSVTFTNVNDAPVIDSRPISEIAVVNSGDILAFTGQLVGRTIGVLSGDGHGGLTPVVVVGVSNSPKPLEASLGDVNGDGIADLVVRDDSVLSVHMADGTGGFSPAVNIATGVSAFKLIDIDGDGSLDIITSDAGGKTGVLAGDGHGGFSPVTAGTNLLGPGFETADVNGDGFLDSVSGSNSTVRVQLGDGHGGFSSPATFANGIDASHLALGDVNGDGAVDIVTVAGTFDPITSQLGANVSVLFGDGRGSFSTPDFLNPGGINPTAIALADLNHDGAADIVTVDPTRNQISIISSDGHGGFLQPVALTDGLSGPNSIAAADITGDGMLDIIVTDDHGNVDLIAGDGHGGFAPTVKFPSGGNSPTAIEVVEVSGAGPLHYIENQSPRRIDPGLTISDADSQNLVSATVSIANNFHAAEDILGFADQNGIHGSYNSSTGVLTLSGVSSVANYQAALRSVTYFNGSDDPSSATRTVSYQVDDGSSQNHSSNIFTASVDVIPADDAPVITRASLTISQGHTVTLTTADIDFVDPDSPVVTYTASNLSHGHFEIGVGNAADETTTFTSADVAAGLVSFVDDGSSGTPTFSLTPNDGSIDGATVSGVVTFSAANYTLTSTEGVIINVTPEGATSGFVFPGAGNVTTPGIPEDRIAIGYDVGASHVVLDNAPLLGVHQMAPVSSETHSSGGTTFVSTTLDAGHGVTLVQTLALASDANFFTTTIDITNNGTADISNLRFLRNFDPDQDVQAHNDYTTFNDVVQNPDGAETFAILSATGVEFHTKVAMIGLGAEWRASVFGFTNTDPYALHAFDQPTIPNSAVPVDLSLSLTSSLGTLAAGDHVEVTYITTNNVATSGSNALYGTVGADTINGLGGDDLLIGLGKADTFVFNAASGGSGHDTIADFTPGLDQIRLDYHAFDAAGPNDFSSWLASHATVSGSSDVLIDLNVDGHHLASTPSC